MKSTLNHLHYLCLAAALQATLPCHAQGLRSDRWTSVSGTSIESLKAVIGTRAPNSTSTLSGSVELVRSNPNVDNFGVRLRGTLLVPEDGWYTFFIAGDDDVELCFSEDGLRQNQRRIAFNRGSTASREFTKAANQRSTMFRLAAGQSCYLEARMKEGGGADGLAVGWTRAVSLSGLAPYAIGNVTTQSWEAQADGGWIISTDTAGAMADVSDNAAFQGGLWEGDGELVVNITAMTFPQSGARAGLMLRASADPGAMMACIAQSSATGMAWLRRQSTGSALVSSGVTGSFSWLKLVRVGDLITAFVSADCSNWFSAGSVTLTGLPSQVIVGPCASDGSTTSVIPTTARFSPVICLTPASTTPQIVPADFLTPFAPDTTDSDDDALPTDWETASGLNPVSAFGINGEFADPDGDYLTNLEEFQRSTNPLAADSFPGGLALQRWSGTALYNISEMIRHTKFLSPAEITGVTAGTEHRGMSTYSSARARGYLTVPTTGSYRFWVAGSNSVELWLSGDATKYRKKKLCGFSSDDGTGHGVGASTNPHTAWDVYALQMSDPVSLVAGQTYYLETLMQNGHAGLGWFSIAWSRDGGARQVVPASAVRSYLLEAEDADDDYLPDAWEQTYGLSTADNGLQDRARQGELGDFDADGLDNRAEYLWGTSPASADSDNDGVSDLEEIQFYRTSPTQSNAITEEEIENLGLLDYNPSGTTGSWQVFDGGLLGSSFRGRIEWTFTVPQDGLWVLELAGRLRGTLRGAETLPVEIAVDDVAMPRQDMGFVNGQTSTLKLVTPWLTAGSHRMSVYVDNEIGRRTLQIQAVRVLRCGGFDADANGRADWLDAILASANSVIPPASSSVVSPAFIEGAARHVGAASLSSGPVSLPVVRGLGDLHWMSNVPLAETGTTPWSVTFEGGASTQSGQITWSRWNAWSASSLTVRAGDSVKIGASRSTTDTGTFQITVAGQTRTNLSAATGWFIQAFPTAGIYPVQMTHSTGSTKTVTITVVGADFGQAMTFYSDRATWRSFPGVPRALWVDSEPSMRISGRSSEGAGARVQLLATRAGPHTLGARIGGKAGPIVGLGQVSTVGFSDALRGDASVFIGSTEDGYRILRTPIVVTYLPTGGRVVLTIFRAGVTFLDGTLVKELSAADFAEGVVWVDFRYPAGMTGGFCHYTDIYDGQNRHLGRH